MRVVGAAIAFCCACGGAEVPVQPIVEAGPDTYFVSHVDAGAPGWEGGADRVTAHEDVIVAAPSLLVLYLGQRGVDAAPPQDGFVDWMLGSTYWGLLEQYGVGAGKRVGSLQVARSQIIVPSDQDASGLVWMDDLDARIRSWVDVNGMRGANALLVFLPDGVDVKLAVRGTYTYQTCIDAYGYHAFDGREPYAVMPACPKGRETDSIAHELAELATNPQSNHGWFSNGDLPKGGGEIGDLCMGRVSMVQGWSVAQLWSNRDQQCMP